MSKKVKEKYEQISVYAQQIMHTIISIEHQTEHIFTKPLSNVRPSAS